jgi:hypothetical protein
MRNARPLGRAATSVLGENQIQNTQSEFSSWSGNDHRHNSGKLSESGWRHRNNRNSFAPSLLFAASGKMNQLGGKSIERGVTEWRSEIFLIFPQVCTRL